MFSKAVNYNYAVTCRDLGEKCSKGRHPVQWHRQTWQCQGSE